MKEQWERRDREVGRLGWCLREQQRGVTKRHVSEGEWGGVWC